MAFKPANNIQDLQYFHQLQIQNCPQEKKERGKVPQGKKQILTGASSKHSPFAR